jgi:sarcosine oxidase subunit beta
VIFMNNNITADIVVIGGGIVGVSATYFLAAQGRRVILVERKGIAAEASGANMGLIIHVTESPGILLEMVKKSSEFYSYLQEEKKVDLEYVQPGVFNPYFSEKERELGKELIEQQQHYGLPVNYVTTEEILSMEPALSKTVDICGGAFCEIDGFLNPFKATIGIADAAKELGAVLMTHTEALGVGVERGRVNFIETNQGRIYTDHIINACGSWAPEIADFVDEKLPIVPVRGEMLVTEPVPFFMKYHLLDVSGRQTKHGSVLIGSCQDKVGYNKQNSPTRLKEIAQGALKRYPRLKGVRVVRCWANLRPLSPDEKPIVGKSQKIEGLIYATGHFSMGMGLGPATGKMVAELVDGAVPDLPIEELSLSRFSKN